MTWLWITGDSGSGIVSTTSGIEGGEICEDVILDRGRRPSRRRSSRLLLHVVQIELKWVSLQEHYLLFSVR